MQNEPFTYGEPRSHARSRIDAVKQAALQATDFIKRQADRGSRELGGRLNAAADELENAGQDMSGTGQELTASVARQLAQVTRRVGYYLERTDTNKMLDDAREFTREQPWTVVAIGMAAGFALSRVVKHSFSSQDRA